MTTSPSTINHHPSSSPTLQSGISTLHVNHFSFLQSLPRDILTPSLAETTEAVIRTARSVPNAAYSLVTPEIPPKPELECVSPLALHLLGLNVSPQDYTLSQWSPSDRNLLVEYFSGVKSMPNAIPWSHMYAGHQFGVFAGQLGDGRVISLGQIKNNTTNDIWEIQLKGAGNTPYSRFGDGFAVLRSSIREFLCSEHFHCLGIPTSRAATLIRTGQPVHRETLEPGAIVLRLAPSWIRFGSFEGFAFRGDVANVARLVKYTLSEVLPMALSEKTTLGHPQSTPTPTVRLYAEVVQRTAKLVAQWDLFAWEHGVLNTDNMSILGITIDYGPYGFLDYWDPDYIVNHSDTGGRYKVRNQREIGQFNLAKLANALVETVGYEEKGMSLDEIAAMKPEQLQDLDERKKVTEIGGLPLVKELLQYDEQYNQAYQEGMRKKLGLCDPIATDYDTLMKPLLSLLEKGSVDWTRFFRTLSRLDPYVHLNENESDPVESIILEAPMKWSSMQTKSGAFSVTKSARMGTESPLNPMKPICSVEEMRTIWRKWRTQYVERVQIEVKNGTGYMDMETREKMMNAVNPKYVLRQWIAQTTIEAAEKGDKEALARTLCVMTDPYADKPRGVEQFTGTTTDINWWEKYADEVPEEGRGIVCSCSS